MTVEIVDKWTPLRKSPGIPYVSTRFSLNVENEQADARRDCRTCLARSNSQARTGTGKYYFPCSADHEQDWQPYPVDPYSAIICDEPCPVLLPLQDSNGFDMVY